MESEPTVFLVDDDEAVRESLRFLMKSVGQRLQAFPTAQAFLEDFDPSMPGCLLLDIRMPGMSGLELMERLRAADSTLPVIIISGHADVRMAVRAMKGGAVDVIEKPFNDQLLLDRIHAAFEENRALRARKALRSEIDARLARLTPRERQVLGLLLEGKVSKEIAAALSISRKTFAIHRLKVLKKMKAENVIDLVRMVEARKEAERTD